MNGNVIEIAGLEKRFHKSGFQLSLPSLCVREGYITGFVGENGAGKQPRSSADGYAAS